MNENPWNSKDTLDPPHRMQSMATTCWRDEYSQWLVLFVSPLHRWLSFSSFSKCIRHSGRGNLEYAAIVQPIWKRSTRCTHRTTKRHHGLHHDTHLVAETSAVRKGEGNSIRFEFSSEIDQFEGGEGEFTRWAFWEGYERWLWMRHEEINTEWETMMLGRRRNEYRVSDWLEWPSRWSL